MKIRVRLPAGLGTLKLDNVSTCGDLVAQVVAHPVVPDCITHEDAKFSLDKKNALDGQPLATLESIGLRHGDLVYVLTDNAAAWAGGNPSAQASHSRMAPATEPACPFWPPELCLEEVRRANSSPDAHRDPLSRVVLLGHAAFLEGGWRPMWQGDPRRLPYSPGATSVPHMEYQATIQASAVVCRAVFSRMGTATLLAVCVNDGPVFKTTLLSLPGLTPFPAQDKAVLRKAWNQVVDHVVSPARLTGLRLAGGEPLICLSGLQLTSVLPLMTQLEALDLCRLACTSRAIQSTILGSERWREALEGRRMAFAFAGFVPRMKTGRGDGVRQIEKEVLCMDKFAAAR
ncbi:hypothetical protein ACKKBF_B30790 [Auxenochlorella protothecoides x Auxenochlorella symbiontica]